MDNRCVVCGDVIPEGASVCPNCIKELCVTTKAAFNPVAEAYEILCRIREGELDETYIDDAIGYLGEYLYE